MIAKKRIKKQTNKEATQKKMLLKVFLCGNFQSNRYKKVNERKEIVNATKEK